MKMTLGFRLRYVRGLAEGLAEGFAEGLVARDAALCQRLLPARRRPMHVRARTAAARAAVGHGRAADVGLVLPRVV